MHSHTSPPDLRVAPRTGGMDTDTASPRMAGYMPIDGVRSLSRASDVLSGCSYGIILRRLHAGGGISVPTTPSHPSSSTAAANRAKRAKSYGVNTRPVVPLDGHG